VMPRTFPRRLAASCSAGRLCIVVAARARRLLAGTASDSCRWAAGDLVRNTLAPWLHLGQVPGRARTKRRLDSRHRSRARAHDVSRQSWTLGRPAGPTSAASWAEISTPIPRGLTQYLFTVPSEDLDVALHIEATRMRGLLDSATDWDKGARCDRAGSRSGSVEPRLQVVEKLAQACLPARRTRTMRSVRGLVDATRVRYARQFTTRVRTEQAILWWSHRDRAQTSVRDQSLFDE